MNHQIKCTIPLQSVIMTADICNNICQFTIDQTYYNSEDTPIEVTYTFPSMADTTVYDFRATINETIVIETMIKPKETAIREYNQAIKDCNQTIFMEQVDGDTFSVCLGNVPAKAMTQIRIRCVLELQMEIDAKHLRLNVPLTIMPKYTPVTNPTYLSTVLDSLQKVFTKPYDFKLIGQIYMSDGIISLNSKTHNIKISDMQQNQLNFEIYPENLDSDIILSVTRKPPTSFIICETITDLPTEADALYKYASQVNIIPDYSLVKETNIKDLSYVIVLDRSGSMDGADFENCIKSAKIFVSALPFDSKFNIYEFGDDYTKFSLEMTICSIETKKKAINWLSLLRCRGGTEVLDVMNDVYKTLKTNPGTIIFLSDGGVSNTEQVIKLVKTNKNTSIYTIGIGQNVSQKLIKSMAESTGGVAEFINSDNDQIREKVLTQLGRAQQTVRKCQQHNKIKINVEGPYKMVPELVNLYEEDVNTFYIFSSNPIRSITYDQYETNGLLQKTHTICATSMAITGSMIHRIAGTKLINAVSDEPGGSQIARLQMDVAKETIIKISQSLGILSKHTAFIGVEICKTTDDSIVVPLLKQVPLQQPRKYRSMEKCLFSNQSCILENMCEIDEVTNCSTTLQSSAVFQKCSSTLKPSAFQSFISGMRTMTDSIMNIFETQDIDVINSKSNNSNVRPRTDNTTDYEIPYYFPNMINGDKVVPPESKVTISYIVKTKLSNYIILDVNAGILSSTINTVIPFASKIKIGEYIELTMENANNGIYKVISLGSFDSPWILEREPTKS